MAITAVDRLFWLSLRDDGLLPERPCVLEIGQANWYGDVSPGAILTDIEKYADPEAVPELMAKAESGDSFAQAEAFYQAVLNPQRIRSIDLHGPDSAHRFDLNEPLPADFPGPHGVVINTGTAEHVFDQRQLFESIHDATADGGLMVHFLPCWGWLDHGFVNYHPTFVADLAAANGYEIVRWWFYDLTHKIYHQSIRGPEDVHRLASTPFAGGSTMHAVALRRKGSEPFKVPMQGYYKGTLSEKLAADWKRLR